MVEPRMQIGEIKSPICLQNHEKETKHNDHQDLSKATRNNSSNISTSKTNLMEAIYFEPDCKNPYLKTLENDTENLCKTRPKRKLQKF